MKKLVGIVGIIASASLAQMPPPFVGDGARIQNLTYSGNRVIPLQAAFGYAIAVEFAEDERVENVVVGNGAGWQISANQRGDHIIVKPVEGAGTTNLVVTTDTRRYVFLLEAGKLGPTTPFVMHFFYPPAGGQTALGMPLGRSSLTMPAPPVASTYKLRGDRTLYPMSISDDGQRTTIGWSRETPMPAIYAIDAQGHEALVNGRMIGTSYVVEGVAAGYVFRLGKARASATRQLPKGRR